VEDGVIKDASRVTVRGWLVLDQGARECSLSVQCIMRGVCWAADSVDPSGGVKEALPAGCFQVTLPHYIMLRVCMRLVT
jgi:hypothetical protein